MNINKLSFFNYTTNNNTASKSETSVNFKGKRNKSVTPPVYKDGIYPAGDLFLMAKKDVKKPELIIDEFYASENSRMLKNPLGVSLSRFSPKDKYEILQYAEDIKLHRSGFSKIINAKNDDKTYRFATGEALTLFFDAGDKIEKYPDEFKRILNEKDSDGNPRFNSKDCSLLMQYIALAKLYPQAYSAVLAMKNLRAEDVINIMLNDGEIIEENPELLDGVKQLLTQKENANNNTKQLNSILKKLYIQKKAKIAEQKAQEREREEALLLEKRQKQKEELARIEEERRIKNEAAAKIRAEKRAIKNAEEKKIKEAKMQEWNQKVGWISPEQLFDKVNTAVNNKTPLILENGEVLPDETRDKIAYYINRSAGKSQKIINARYKNLQPIFNEKDCCEILSDFDSYFYPQYMSSLKSVRRDGTPVFSVEQCKELLKLKQNYRDEVINSYLLSTYRNFSAEDIVDIMKNSDVTIRYDSPFRNLIIQKNESGQYRYSVRECIELSRKQLEENK